MARTQRVPWLEFLDLCEIFPQQILPLHIIAFYHIFTAVHTISPLQAALGSHRHLLTALLIIVVVIAAAGRRRGFLNLLDHGRLVLSDSCRARRLGFQITPCIVFGFEEAGQVAQRRSAVALTVGRTPHQNGELGN